MMKIEGRRDADGRARVVVDGEVLDPAPSQQVWNHSPDGFNWGYGGSGPAQLALAILLEAGLTPARATALHQTFKWQHLAHLPADGFTLQLDVRAWAEARP